MLTTESRSLETECGGKMRSMLHSCAPAVTTVEWRRLRIIGLESLKSGLAPSINDKLEAGEQKGQKAAPKAGRLSLRPGTDGEPKGAEWSLIGGYGPTVSRFSREKHARASEAFTCRRSLQKRIRIWPRLMTVTSVLQPEYQK